MPRKIKPVTGSPTADFLGKAIALSGKTQREIAQKAGYPKPNVLSMMKRAQTKVPIERIPAVPEQRRRADAPSPPAGALSPPDVRAHSFRRRRAPAQ